VLYDDGAPWQWLDTRNHAEQAARGAEAGIVPLPVRGPTSTILPVVVTFDADGEGRPMRHDA
jgi:hypothetical protein